MTLMRRSIVSTFWSSGANLLYLLMSLARSILLARLLPVEVFGVYVAVRAIVGITAIIPNWGMGGAFIHRATEVEDEQIAASVHFTLKLIFTAVWVIALTAYVWLFSTQLNTTALIVIISTVAVSHLIQTPTLILTRRVVHRRLAIGKAINGMIGFIVSLVFAQIYLKSGQINMALWALLSIHIITVLVNGFMLYVWKPVWKPKLRWDKNIVRYFITFGGKNFWGIILLQFIDRVDDLWVKANIGDAGLGFYSRAYTFATYPRELVARPINQVIGGTYAGMKSDRVALSKVFFQANSFLIRSGFYLGGLLFWIAPEFIHLILTDKWMPMLAVFRLMLLFTLIDPLKMTASRLMVSMGDAARPIPARLLQLLILIIGLYLFGPIWGIEGVAVAVNSMLLIGVAILFCQIRTYVDFSLRELFLVPLASLASAAIVTGLVDSMITDIDWVSLIIKTAVFTTIYGIILILFEREETLRLFQLRRYLRTDT